MEIRINLNGKTRKDLAHAVGALLNAVPVYQKPPSYAYDIGGVILNRTCTLVFPADMNAETIRQLLDGLVTNGFVAEELPDKLVIQMPLTGFDPASLDNLRKIIASKSALIKKALGVDALPVEQTDDAVSFPWFAFDTPSSDIAVYTQFITALCAMAKKQKRVLAVERPVENEKYAFRCFLLRLGFIGETYANARRVLLHNLTGNGSIKSGKRKSAPPPAEQEDVADADSTEEAPTKSKFSLRGLIGSFMATR